VANTQSTWRTWVDGLVRITDPGAQVVGALRAEVAVHQRTLAKSVSYTLSPDTDWLILATSGAGGITLTLPSAVGIAGCEFIIKKVDSGAGAVTIATTSSQTIDGGAASAQNLTAQWQSRRFVSDGANWITT
jgi:hypothetical protein